MVTYDPAPVVEVLTNMRPTITKDEYAFFEKVLARGKTELEESARQLTDPQRMDNLKQALSLLGANTNGKVTVLLPHDEYERLTTSIGKSVGSPKYYYPNIIGGVNIAVEAR
jgi:hypothetical protein